MERLGKMNKIKARFAALKLDRKISLTIVITVIIPIFILSSLYFQNVRKTEIQKKIKAVELSFTRNYAEIQKKVEMCTMSTQVVIHSRNIWRNIIAFDRGERGTIHELLDFYNNDIASLEKLVNSNPYLYQIRIYVDADVQEMMPILYRKTRMMRLSWAKSDFESGSWQFDYTDQIFPSFVLRPVPHIAGFVTKVPDLEDGLDATIEVSTRMETLFPDMYASDKDEWVCFVDAEGSIYYDLDRQSPWLEYTRGFYTNMEEHSLGYAEERMTDKGHVIVCVQPIQQLGGHLIKIVSLDQTINEVNRTRNQFLFIVLLITTILILFTKRMIGLILKRFYEIIDMVHQIRKGDLGIRVMNPGQDEMGELGLQINKLLDYITRLMEDNIKRELLFKDSEIRALQNQINAHFIYNVLESIKMMAEIDAKFEIADAVTSLGKLLRYSMKWVSKNVTVEEEIDYIKNYLALMNLRFDYEIYLSQNIPERIYSQEIPKMSLQPIIENAIYHGIEGLTEDTSIYMKGIMNGDCCTIEITDSGRGMTEEELEELQKKIDGEIETSGSSGNGIGLKNVQDRIKFTFGSNYGISVASKKNCFTKVIVKIPFK
jgi:two-component system sensor histidine kinase YesM